MPGFNLYWLFVAAGGLAYAIETCSMHKRAPRDLVRAALWLTVTPGIFAAPVVWALAMRAIDGETAKLLNEWREGRERRTRSA